MLTYWQEETRPEWLKGVRRMGRYRKYRTDKALREMVEAYFRSISREKLVMEALYLRVATGQRPERGIHAGAGVRDPADGGRAVRLP